jgi:UDP-N-acetylenolpyruvoylglucosamine reductase
VSRAQALYRENASVSNNIELVEKIENEICGTFGVRLGREIRILNRLSRSRPNGKTQEKEEK